MYTRGFLVFLAFSTFLASEYAGAQEVHMIGPLRIHTPTQGAWNVASKTDHSIVFRRLEPSDVGDTVAYLSAFRSKGSLDENGLLAEVKAKVDTLLQVSNAKVTSRSFSLQRGRPYPCVTVRSEMEIAANQSVSGKSLVRQMRLHVCQPKGKAAYGFAVGFAYTAHLPQERNESDADAFFEGVQVSDSK